MAITHITKENFDDIIGGEKLVLVDFFATWCGPCKMLGPILEQISEERDDVIIAKCDIDECMDITQRFGIMSVPTMILFKQGKELTKEIGLKTKDYIVDVIEANLQQREQQVIKATLFCILGIDTIYLSWYNIEQEKAKKGEYNEQDLYGQCCNYSAIKRSLG